MYYACIFDNFILYLDNTSIGNNKIMKTLSFEQMEQVNGNGGLTGRVVQQESLELASLRRRFLRPQ